MILPFVGEMLSRVGRHPAVERALDALRHGPGTCAQISGLTDTAKALVVAHAALALNRSVVMLVESNARAELMFEPIRFFFDALSGKAGTQVCMLPEHDVLPWQGLSPHPAIAETRAASLWRFATGQVSVLLVPVAAARMKLRESAYYAGLARELRRESAEELEALNAHLAAVGYERHDTVEMPGQYAVRGGIVDVFSPEAARPARLEFFGDTLESLREFDPRTQRSVRTIDHTVLLPLNEVRRQGEQLEWLYRRKAAKECREAVEAPLADVFPGWEFQALQLLPPVGSLFDLQNELVAILDEPEVLGEASQKFSARVADAFQHASVSEHGGPAAEPEVFFLNDLEWASSLQRIARLSLSQLALSSQTPALSRAEELLAQPTIRYRGNVRAFMAEVRGRLREGEQVIASAANIGELERLADLCHEYELAFQLGELGEHSTLSRLAGDSSAGSVPALTVLQARLQEGVTFPELKLTIFGTSDLFETLPVTERRRRPVAATFFSGASELQAGDYVVHVDHGIGQFDGLKLIPTDGTATECMQLRYADDARLYVPLARMDLVQKYRALAGARPQLDRLGGTAWASRKQRVRQSVTDLAERLLRLYAQRRSSEGYAFPPDTTWQREFEDAFEFEETLDQGQAIQDVKADMERATPMDRLLCGDVGYGKTEVAMRAAFKAVSDSRQVAVLAPTTVLVLQHFETFKRRFAAFPVRVEMLSRFRTAKEQKQVLTELAAGRVDIVIGTHRLLSKDVRFHDLGLLVVDEEQRFGVAAKERIKELRRNVDVLTLSATPIPRTLHMSLVGLRDMSVIETPPKDRLAIQTVVAPFSEKLVQDAIERELEREGQVFFVHNRVQSIYSVAAMLQRLVPRARIAVGHGQMSERELEKVMLRFVRREADILVSTSIIENGLDIPRCNTIIINRADRFGLAELYQLRGRVGRSNQRAYAFLLVPAERSLSALARRRLAALREFSDLGAGFRIAALDLELRGAGNLLGPQQHGHVNAVGFDLYCRMLERAVAEEKGETPQPELRATLSLGLEIRIPPEYVPQENVRLRAYQRIAAISSEGERDEVARELEDRFGPLPRAVENLLDYALLKSVCERLGVAAVERRHDQIAVKFYEQTPVRPERLVALVRANASRGTRLDPSGVLWLPVKSAGPAPNASAAAVTRNVLLQLEA
jgi:transcription-repair coupling factor (superfamily II helicase)